MLTNATLIDAIFENMLETTRNDQLEHARCVGFQILAFILMALPIGITGTTLFRRLNEIDIVHFEPAAKSRKREMLVHTVISILLTLITAILLVLSPTINALKNSTLTTLPLFIIVILLLGYMIKSTKIGIKQLTTITNENIQRIQKMLYQINLTTLLCILIIVGMWGLLIWKNITAS